MELVVSRFALIGNHLSLDFANTVHAKGSPVDVMTSLEEAFEFLLDAKIFSPAEIVQARRDAELRPDEAQSFFATARRLRGYLREWLAGIETHAPVATDLIEMINGILASQCVADRLTLQEGRWIMESVPSERRLVHLLVPIARSAAQLIAQGPDVPVRKCGNPKCPLYFYDTSRNKLRRWCSMSSCGNLHKVKAHLARRSTVVSNKA